VAEGNVTASLILLFYEPYHESQRLIDRDNSCWHLRVIVDVDVFVVFIALL
jgi:hypothetical protein